MVGRPPRAARSPSPTARHHRHRHLRPLSSSPRASPTAPRSPAPLTWTAAPSGTTVSSVDFLIDGTVKWTENITPYQFNGDPSGTLDTTTLSDGAHTPERQGARHGWAYGDRDQLCDGHERSGDGAADVRRRLEHRRRRHADRHPDVDRQSDRRHAGHQGRFHDRRDVQVDGSGRPVPVRRRSCRPPRHDVAQERAAHARGDGVRNGRPDRHRIVVGHGLERGKPAAGAVVRKHPAVRHRHRLQDPRPERSRPELRAQPDPGDRSEARPLRLAAG